MCNEEEMFSSIEGVQNGIKLANDTTMQAIAKGNVDIIANNGDKIIPYTLLNTLHVPGLRTNLLSIAQWARRPAKTAKSQLWNFKIIKWLL